MIILDIANGHWAAASLMIDGVIVDMIQEERFSKCKNQAAFPLHHRERRKPSKRDRSRI
jgi:predicted NodU family carbamoyl transferase